MPRLPSEARTSHTAQGYYVARGCVDHALIDALLQDINQVLTVQLDRCRLPSAASGEDLEGIYDKLKMLFRHDQAVYLATLRVFNKFKSLYELFLAESIASACSGLGMTLPIMHTLPLFHILSNRLVIDGGYHGFEAHQDWSGLQTSLNAIVVWVPLHDIDRGRFPLEVLPQSHLHGVCRGVLDGQGYKIDDSYLVGQEFVPVTVRKGDVVFLSPFTIHRTGLTDTDELRLAASWRYEDALEPTFVERKYPFAQTRTVRHELASPDFPSSAQMRELLIDRL
jgi:ectoine hydroxylase-related dioxygenase (phytanoyl-CoA dioxygenase family)